VFEGGVGERDDVAAAIEYAELHDLPKRWLLGWSFGTELALMHGADPSIEGAILLSPPLHLTTAADLAGWDAFGKPLKVLVPELDDYLRLAEARERFAAVRQAEVIGVDGARHLWVGEAAVRRVLNEIVETVTPGSAPLPTGWDGMLGTDLTMEDVS
jgi:alpha/beta superfamily hydrolase